MLPGIGSRVSTASGVIYGKLHGLQSRFPTCSAGASPFLPFSSFRVNALRCLAIGCSQSAASSCTVSSTTIPWNYASRFTRWASLVTFAEFSNSLHHPDTRRACYVEPVRFRRYFPSSTPLNPDPEPSISVVVLLIRTYAFFNRNAYLLSFLIACLSGLIAYQLYVATSQMECKLWAVVPRYPLISNSAPVYTTTRL